MERRRGGLARRLSLVLTLALVLPVAIGIAIVKVWVPSVVAQYGVSRQGTIDRVHSNRLVVNLARHADKPFNAAIEEAMYVKLEDVPPVMVDAVLNSEDRRFFWHRGIDPLGLLNALLSFASDNPRGGSTITQQLAKNIYVGNAPTFSRKRDEAAIAIWLEMNFSKQEILELYLNTPFMGEENKGIEAAARHYLHYSFKVGRDSQKPFTPEMAASLAVTIKDPTHGNPNKARNRARAEALVAAMDARGVASLTQARRDALIARVARTSVPARDHRLDSRFQFARDIAVKEAAAILGRADRRVEITSSYDSEVQLYLERAAGRFQPRFAQAGYDRMLAVVVDNRTGGIEAIIAPPDPSFYPGSTVKPFVALCGLMRHDMNADTGVRDEPVGVPPVRNADKRYLGPISLADALAKSRNPPFVAMLSRFGVACPNEILADLGSPFRFSGPNARSMALGAEPVPLFDVLQSYVTLATCGRVAVRPHLVMEIRDAASGLSLYDAPLTERRVDERLRRALDATQLMLVRTAGRGGTAEGSQFLSTQVAVKTGTSDENRQVTLITFTQEHTVLVSVSASRLDRIRHPLTGHALVPMVERINANIHSPDAVSRLGCPVAPTVVASR